MKTLSLVLVIWVGLACAAALALYLWQRYFGSIFRERGFDDCGPRERLLRASNMNQRGVASGRSALERDRLRERIGTTCLRDKNISEG